MKIHHFVNSQKHLDNLNCHQPIRMYTGGLTFIFQSILLLLAWMFSCKQKYERASKKHVQKRYINGFSRSFCITVAVGILFYVSLLIIHFCSILKPSNSMYMMRIMQLSRLRKILWLCCFLPLSVPIIISLYLKNWDR